MSRFEIENLRTSLNAALEPKQQERNGGHAQPFLLFRLRAITRSPKSIGRWAIPRVSKRPSCITRRSLRCVRRKMPFKKPWWHRASWAIAIAKEGKSRRRSSSITARLDCSVRSVITSPISTRSTPAARQVEDIRIVTRSDRFGTILFDNVSEFDAVDGVLPFAVQSSTYVLERIGHGHRERSLRRVRLPHSVPQHSPVPPLLLCDQGGGGECASSP